jgi:hypothetical protein
MQLGLLGLKLEIFKHLANGYSVNLMMFLNLYAKIMILNLVMNLRMIFSNYSMDVHFYGYVMIQAIPSGLNIQMNGM